MSTIARSLRSSLASTVASSSRSTVISRTISGYGFDASSPNAGPSGWRDEARNPVIRDQLVPIVVEQTVCSSLSLQDLGIA